MNRNLHYSINIALRVGYIDKETRDQLEDLVEKIRASLKNLIKSLGGGYRRY